MLIAYNINDLLVKGLRNKLSSLMTHLKSLANFEKVTSKTIANYLPKLYSQEEHDFKSAQECKEILSEGTFSLISQQISCDKAANLVDSLEIGKSKYIDLKRVLLNENIKFPGYNKLAAHRTELTLSEHMY